MTLDAISGQRYCEMRPLTKSRFSLVMVVLEEDGELSEADIEEAGALARLACMSINSDIREASDEPLRH